MEHSESNGKKTVKIKLKIME